METFMNKDFLLESNEAKQLFHQCAATLPIIDYHCHIPAYEIAENMAFDNISQLWLGADHYKWRYMRSCGIEEKYITGNASDKDKFIKWASCLGKAIGNPLFSWSHLELQRYFDYHDLLWEDTAEAVWHLCNQKLKTPQFHARQIIKKSNVHLICTTDDPIDTLKWHKQIADDPTFSVKVLPTFRPDLALEIGSENYIPYIKKLSEAAALPIAHYSELKKALIKRLDKFIEHGCRLTDHGLTYVMYVPCSEEEASQIFTKKMNGGTLSQEEILKFKTALLLFLAENYAKKGLVMQLHYGCLRDNNTKMLHLIGKNTGYDCISSYTPADQLSAFLNALEQSNTLPKTILYSLNPNDNAIIGAMIGCFQNADAITKIQQGSAWWFNDNQIEIEKQLASFASLSSLNGFVGMLTDSRSLLSYTRHEYFRRILCNYIGHLVEKGAYPKCDALLFSIIKNICYNNAVRYFELPLKMI